MINNKFSQWIIIFSILSIENACTYEILPPTTIKIDTFYIQKNEVSNANYTLFLNHQEKDSAELLSLYPNSTVWYAVYPTNLARDYANNYLISYPDLPVVGVTHRQAKMYCAWFSKYVKVQIKQQENDELTYARLIRLSNQNKIMINYRLPTLEEWELISAKSGLYDITADNVDPKKFKKYHLTDLRDQFNVKTSNKTLRKQLFEYYLDHPEYFLYNLDPKDGPFLVTQLYNYPIAPEYDSKKLQHWIGNVAEMTATPGIAKGGSWIHTYDESHYEKSFRYTSPSALLGFRCICEFEMIP